MKYRFIIVLVVCLLAHFVMGQQATLRVVDKMTGDPVPFAHVRIEGIANGKVINLISDLKGYVPNEAEEVSTVGASCMGFLTLTDTGSV